SEHVVFPPFSDNDARQAVELANTVSQSIRLALGRSGDLADSAIVDERPPADAAQSRTQRPIHTWFESNIQIPPSLLLIRLLGRLGIDVDVRAFDLFDQQEDGLPDGAKLVVAIGCKADGPGVKLFNLGLL